MIERCSPPSSFPSACPHQPPLLMCTSPRCPLQNKLTCRQCLLRRHYHSAQTFRKLTNEQTHICSFSSAIEKKKALAELVKKKAERDRLRAMRKIQRNLERQLKKLDEILPEKIAYILSQYTLKGMQDRLNVSFDVLTVPLDRVEADLDAYMKEQQNASDEEQEMEVEQARQPQEAVIQTEIQVERHEIQEHTAQDPPDTVPPAQQQPLAPIQLQPPQVPQRTQTPSQAPSGQVKEQGSSSAENSNKKRFPTIKRTKPKQTSQVYQTPISQPAQPTVIQIEEDEELTEFRQCQANAEQQWQNRQHQLFKSQQNQKALKLSPLPLPKAIVHRSPGELLEATFNSFQNAANYVLMNSYLTSLRITINPEIFDERMYYMQQNRLALISAVKGLKTLDTLYLKIGQSLALEPIELQTFDTQISELPHLHTFGIFFKPHSEAAKNFKFENLERKLGMGFTCQYI